ncbi:hypothetical protein DICPUDRAFT_26566 [Dictyostelium purpureum]|uniref:Ribosome biogenesis protein WDR12 homolog n=1 Tax=Dictyostelium purpureum TaxID=5786 RepID=F0Z8W9_DICPU|nr:uncharacterized protein DICPUDRAFT_26566 [Dictyostelium purpureum]EGC39617.1 hypothetical protein DICPUDRAFT_26566 [Dictyostelium purpureum]|eukprot:XP_003283838.1 hypothetical protein DICPUDRAFT_26566 [Dictyostelium purpureum]
MVEKKVNNKEESKVKVKFITNDPNIRVTDTPIAVPVRLARLGLSEVIHHLREDIEENSKPFDFLINGKFIRTTLDTHIKNNSLSEEDIITIEYLEAITEPKREKECQHDDWVSSVHGGNFGLIVSGSYDLGVRVWDSEGNLISTGTGHLAGVKCVSWINDKDNSNLSFVSASLDKTLRVWNFNKEQSEIKALAVLKEHTGSVESVDVSPDQTRIVSGSMDGTIKLWSIKNIPNTPAAAPSNSSLKKRKTTTAPETIHEITESIQSVSVPNCQGITTVNWETQFQLLSGSMDHNIKLWDVNTLTQTESIHTSSSLTDISYTVESGLIASAHKDKTIRIWDPRESDQTKAQIQSLFSHKTWVTSVCWKPNSKHHLCSTSHDGTIKYWDIRTKIPFYTIDNLEKTNEKVLTSSWINNNNNDNYSIVSGGTDSKLRIHYNDNNN